MQRKEWEFEYTAGKIAEAARAKAKHHRGRLSYYGKKRKELMTTIKEEGLEIVESVTRYTAQPERPTVMVRNDLNKQLDEVVQKERSHQSLVADYEGWVQVLEANAESRLKLHHDDWLYFFGTPVYLADPDE